MGPDWDVVGDQPDREEKQDAVADFLGAMRAMEVEQVKAIEKARPALDRLVKACAEHRVSGQILKVRDLLYSAWNGQATALNEILGLDWALKKDLMAVLLAFGCEPSGHSFFYDAVSDAFRSLGLFDWFTDAHSSGLGRG